MLLKTGRGINALLTGFTTSIDLTIDENSSGSALSNLNTTDYEIAINSYGVIGGTATAGTPIPNDSPATEQTYSPFVGGGNSLLVFQDVAVTADNDGVPYSHDNTVKIYKTPTNPTQKTDANGVDYFDIATVMHENELEDKYINGIVILAEATRIADGVKIYIPYSYVMFSSVHNIGASYKRSLNYEVYI